MPRFVVLHHECEPSQARGPHWDFMLEADGVLRTWALAQLPTAGEPIVAEQLADHRLAYLDYEGEISGGRGSVTRWDRGGYRVARESSDEIIIVVDGGQLRGYIALVRLSAGSDAWQFRFTEDPDSRNLTMYSA